MQNNNNELNRISNMYPINTVETVAAGNGKYIPNPDEVLRNPTENRFYEYIRNIQFNPYLNNSANYLNYLRQNGGNLNGIW